MMPLIEPGELAERLSDERCVAVDCRFELLDPEAGRAAYESGHIPGARYADLDRDLARAPTAAEGRHPLPAASNFAATLGAWGVDERSFVVAYDAHGGAIAARLWWLVRWVGHEAVAVLNGGLPAWEALGLPTETGAPAVEPRIYPAREAHDEWIVTTQALAAGREAGLRLLDARARRRFDGLEEPIDPVAGHVPGAVNLPFSSLLDGGGRFLEPATLRRRFEEISAADAAEHVVAMCGSGVTACHLLLAMHAAGLPANRLYAGSWSEWIRDSARPVARGSASW